MTMKFLDQAFEQFSKKKPVSVMVRATIENVLSAERLDTLFATYAEIQYPGELMFSTVADLMGQVVLRTQPSINAAYLQEKDEIGVTVKSVYNKLSGIEPAVMRQMVRQTAARMRAIIKQCGGEKPPQVAGYRLKIVDGNHLHRTDRRLGELRELNIAPLPGKCLVVLEPQVELVTDVFPCEDGHAQERSLIPQMLETVEARDLWLADRNFCTIGCLLGISRRKACFVIRQHAGMPFELRGRRKYMGESETGKVYQQAMQVTDPETGEIFNFRRVTVILNQPTRDEDQEIHLVTNLLQKVTAIEIAQLYRERWQIETAFQKMAESLDGEIKTLGFPKAALFGFCIALVTLNLLSVVRGAVAGVHGHEAADALSTYYLCNEVSSTSEGMSAILEPEFWQERYGSLTPSQIAAELRRLVHNLDLTKYAKGKWKPKSKKAPLNKKNRGHKSTFRILQAAKVKKKPDTNDSIKK